MAKRKTTSQPELEERKKYNYPLELVASVALALLNQGPEPDEELTPADERYWVHSWDRAVMDAIAFPVKFVGVREGTSASLKAYSRH